MADERIPIIRFRDFILVSIQIELKDRLVLQLKEDITRTVSAARVRGLILDLTGIDFMDSYISRAIRDIGLMAKLMGVTTVVCGMNPAIATTLVDMGIELRGIPMALNLDAATKLLEAGARDEGAWDGVLELEDEHEQHWVID